MLSRESVISVPLIYLCVQRTSQSEASLVAGSTTALQDGTGAALHVKQPLGKHLADGEMSPTKVPSPANIYAELRGQDWGLQLFVEASSAFQAFANCAQGSLDVPAAPSSPLLRTTITSSEIACIPRDYWLLDWKSTSRGWHAAALRGLRRCAVLGFWGGLILRHRRRALTGAPLSIYIQYIKATMEAGFHGQYNTVSYVLFSALVAHQILRRFETHLLSFNALVLLVPPALLTALSVNYDTLTGWTTNALVAYPRTLTLYLALLATVIVVYRISPLHPLAQHPGPFLCKVTAFWMAYLSLDGEQHRYIRSLHERYGDVVRIGPNLLSVRKPSATPGLLGISGAPKGPHQMGRVLSDTRITMIGIQDTETHLLRRRAWARGFTPTALKAYEERIARRVAQLVARLKEQKGEFLLNQWFNAFSYDLMSDMAFGGGTNLLEGKDDDGFWPGLKKTATTATFFGHVPWFGILLGRIPWVFLGNKAFLAVCRNNAARRLARGTQTPDLFHYLSHEDIQGAGKNEPRPSMDQIVNDGILTMVAGSDTTSGTLTGLFACLLSNPAAYAALEAEVDRFYPPGEAITTKHFKEMHYLTAVLNETLRLFPAVPAGTQRQVQRNGDGITVDSLYVPPGTIFWMHVYSLHRDPHNFSPSPNAFLPERWLASPSAAAETGYTVAPMAGYVHNEAAFLPFSHGPMNCVGKALAQQQLKTAACALLQRFRIRPREGWTLRDYERNVKDYFVTVRGPLPVTLEVRGGKSE